MFSYNEIGMDMKKFFLIPAALVFILSLSACGSKTETELFESAQNNIKEKNYAEALADFQQILEKHKEGKYAGEAMLEIGKLYHGKVIKNISVDESMKKAVEYYKMVFEKYRDQEYSKKALFMAGFILANDIKDYDAAREVYNQFLDEYPESEMAISAKYELENLGKDPEEILQKNNSTKK